MLVLARKINESIRIGEDIEVVVVDIKGDQVKLGIRAPRSVTVHRAEVFTEIQEENKQAASANPESLKEIQKLIPGKKKKDDKK